MARRLQRGDEGFSLIELMVVVLIIAILLAIAIPTFFRTRQQANDRAVQSNIRNAFTGMRVFYNENLEYSDAPADLITVEPSLLWSTAPLDATATSRTIYVAVYDVPGPAQTVVIGGRTDEGRCFYIRDVMGGATAGTYYAEDVDTSDDCPAPTPGDVTLPSWT